MFTICRPLRSLAAQRLQQGYLSAIFLRSRASKSGVAVDSQMKHSMIHRILQWRPRTVFLLAALLIAAIAITDWKIVFEATLGFLYMFPLVLLGTIWGWWQLALAAAFCTFLSDRLDPFPVDMQVPRNILIYVTLVTAGLLSRAVTRAYRREVESVARAEHEILARRALEEQLE